MITWWGLTASEISVACVMVIIARVVSSEVSTGTSPEHMVSTHNRDEMNISCYQKYTRNQNPEGNTTQDFPFCVYVYRFNARSL